VGEEKGKIKRELRDYLWDNTADLGTLYLVEAEVVIAHAKCPKCGCDFAVEVEGDGANINCRCPNPACGTLVFGTAHAGDSAADQREELGI
jgi:ribosomal protein S27AE